MPAATAETGGAKKAQLPLRRLLLYEIVVQIRAPLTAVVAVVLVEPLILWIVAWWHAVVSAKLDALIREERPDHLLVGDPLAHRVVSLGGARLAAAYRRLF